MAKSVDVAVVGGGPGGYVAALRAAKNGLTTALVEREKRLGGTCLLRGCIPTKALLETARRMDDIRRAQDFAIGLPDGAAVVDMEKVVRRKDRLVARLSAGIAGLCRNAGVQVMRGSASLVSPHELSVVGEDGTSETVEAKSVILATGSKVRDLPGIVPDHRRILTSDSALSLDHVPGRLAVLGSGAVGLEFASAFRSLGAQVAVIESMDRILPVADADVSEEISRAFRRRGIALFTSARVNAVHSGEEGVKVCFAIGEGGGERSESLDVDALLVAVGRECQVEGLGLERVGIQLERGRIPVGPDMQTRVAGVYAVGDLVASPALAHVASREGVIAADAIAGRAFSPLDVSSIPSAVYCSPEAAFVGLTEGEARRKGISVAVGRFPFAACGKAVVMGEVEGFVKLVADGGTGRVLGAHVVGPHATEFLGELGTAVSRGLTLEEVSGVVHAHPTLSETVGEAALVGLGRPLNI